VTAAGLHGVSMLDPRTRRVRYAGAAVLGAAGLAACTSGSVDKQGADAAPTVRTLEIGMPDYAFDDPASVAFVEAVKARSNGRITLDVDASTYVSSDPKNEAKLIADLEAGTIDGGFPAARGYAAAGVPSFLVLQTPFLCRRSTPRCSWPRVRLLPRCSQACGRRASRGWPSSRTRCARS